jgi:hypothetical protein
MSEKLTVNVKQNKTGYEGTVQLPGLKATKLTRKDGTTTFPSSSAVKTVARSVGTRLGLEVSYAEPAAKKLAAKPKAKKAAKASAKKSAPAKAAKVSAKKSAPAKAAKPACPSSSDTASTSTNS